MLEIEKVKQLETEVLNLIEFYKPLKVTLEIETLEKELQNPDIWTDLEKTKTLNQKLTAQKAILKKIDKLKNLLEEMQIALELDENESLEKIYEQLESKKIELENEKFLNGKFDSQGAILNIYAGAGGLDAQDWATMLVQMYEIFAKKMDWQVKTVDLSLGEEGGVKSATLDISGNFVYGFLKEETGVHRLVRQSPFNSSHTRETSFALVEAIPNNLQEFYQKQILDEKDLRWDYFMSSGKGGQSVNTTYSAVRVTHLPTGISISCQNERSQLQNKAQALKYLENKLLALEAKKNQEMEKELKGIFSSPQWGNQIRNYVLHPYKLVKDLRSSWETNNVDSILTGADLLPIIWSVKRNKEIE
jgi:peptide chain release factor 2